MRCSVFLATSLDGFIAREDDCLDWLDRANKSLPPGEDGGFADFLAGVDVLVIGRASFEIVLGFGLAAWPYGARRVVVLTRRPLALPPALEGQVETSQEAPVELLARLRRQGARHAYVDGGLTVQRFLAEDLVDALTLTVVPVLLGRGKRPFGALPRDRWLSVDEVRTWPGGFVQLRYERTPPVSPPSATAGAAGAVSAMTLA